jgi:hypothetical protein
MSYIPNGSDTGEMSRLVFRASWGEEVSSPRVGLTLFLLFVTGLPVTFRNLCSSPRHPHTTLFNLSFSVCFAIIYVFQYNHGAHPLATGRHSGKCPRLQNTRALPQVCAITHTLYPPMRARTHSLIYILLCLVMTTSFYEGIEYRLSCFSRLFYFSFFLEL